MTDYLDEELDIDSIDVEEVLAAKDPDKRKEKARKAPKGEKKSKPAAKPKGGLNEPLSMAEPSREDLTLYENKMTALKVNSQTPQSYSISQRFTVGDVIQHKTFGIGFVLAEQGLNKIEVLFDKGRKLLVTAPRS